MRFPKYRKISLIQVVSISPEDIDNGLIQVEVIFDGEIGDLSIATIANYKDLISSFYLEAVKADVEIEFITDRRLIGVVQESIPISLTYNSNKEIWNRALYKLLRDKMKIVDREQTLIMVDKAKERFFKNEKLRCKYRTNDLTEHQLQGDDK